jgi:hypothetical protein
VLPPFAEDASAWFVETARAAVMSGARLDAAAVELLIALAPGDPAISVAIANLEHESPNPEPGTWNLERGSLAAVAREAIVRLRQAVAAGDEPAARETVTAFEEAVLRTYRPSHGLDSFPDDAAVAIAMLAVHDVGGDETHLMMAEELMLGVIRREWHRRAHHGLAANCDAAVALAALAARTGKAEYQARALEVMHGYAATYRDHGVDAAPYVSALRVIS